LSTIHLGSELSLDSSLRTKLSNSTSFEKRIGLIDESSIDASAHASQTPRKVDKDSVREEAGGKWTELDSSKAFTQLLDSAPIEE